MLQLLALGLHEGPHPYDGRCVSPGQCTPPPAKYSKVIAGPQPGQQWNINGGFCGAFSTQHAALAFGAWVSQDLVRKANRNSAPPHTMHGDSTEGYEVMPTNVADTAKNLKLTYDEWDYTQPSPQAPAYKAWLKKQLDQKLNQNLMSSWDALFGEADKFPFYGECPPFVSFLRNNVDNPPYEIVSDSKKLKDMLTEELEDYALSLIHI